MASPVIEKLFQISSPVPVGMYPLLATLLLTSGLLTTGGFFLYQVTKTRQNRSLSSEIILACLASVLLGLGMLFMLLWSGVYV